tara:strand:- start:43 stop:366 length:324 start_codon:yes stop_codon:yes gene_type:complete
MTVKLPLSEVIATAKEKLSSASACLNDSSAFSSALAEFDSWLSEHKELITAPAPEQVKEREEINQLIHQLTRLELQARFNISLVSDMQSYIHSQLEDITTFQITHQR